MTKKRLRVLSYNIHKGFNIGNRRFVLENIRHALRATEADILCLQEVVGENQRRAKKHPQSISESQLEFLADTIWSHHAYGKNAVYPQGHHGNAILSKFAFSHYANHDISVLPFSQRGVLHAITENGIHVLCAHLGLLAWERRHQMQKLQAILQTIPLDAPLILAGDFNDWQEQAHVLLLQSGLREALQDVHGKPQKTFPSAWPMLRMDRIYYRHLQLQAAACLHNHTWRLLSDHCPLYAEFSYPE